MTITIEEKTTKVPWSSGKSGAERAWKVSSPSPGQENTVSTVTAPPTSPPRVRKIRVTVGSRALGTACRRRTASSRRPLARAVMR
jgi:hypothetical protein